MNSEYIKNLILKVDDLNRKKEKDGLVSKARFIIIEKEGCPYCINSKKLLIEKNFKFEVKKKLSPEEEDIIIKQTGKKYKYYPKIFELKECGEEYTFLGGFDELKKRLKI
jgi:glutaredoxin